jgi:thiol:disulfide interchange protein DsbC
MTPGKPLALLAMTWLLGPGSAWSDSGADAVYVKRLRERFPATTDAVIVPALPGFHAIVREGQVVYLSDDFRYLVQGNITDLQSNTSLSSALLAKYPRRVEVSRLELRDAIVFGSGERRLYVFSDPDCPFCRQLQPELAKLRNVTVYVFPYPLTVLHPNAAIAAKTIWCQQDRADAWNAYVMQHVALESRDCETPIERNLAVGQALGIKGTPTMLFPDGTVVSGFETAERISAQIDAARGAQ